MPTRIIVQAGDQHAGSTVGLLHPDGVYHDDGQHILPGTAQRWLWEQHERFIADVAAIIDREKKKDPNTTVHYFNTGDLVDGDHHNTTQILGRENGLHIEVGADILSKGILRLGFDTIHVLRGTPSHVGKGAGLEKAVANRLKYQEGLPVVRDPAYDSFAWRHVYAEFNGILFDIRHHGRTGMREHTRKSYQALYAYDIWGTHVTEHRRPPDIAIRSHKHKFMDSGPDHRGVTRVIACACWQHPTEWVASRAIESLPDYGGLVIVVPEDIADPYEVQVRPLLYRPEDDQPWRP